MVSPQMAGMLWVVSQQRCSTSGFGIWGCLWFYRMILVFSFEKFPHLLHLVVDSVQMIAISGTAGSITASYPSQSTAVIFSFFLLLGRIMELVKDLNLLVFYFGFVRELI